MVGGAALQGRPQVTQEAHVGRARERDTTRPGGEEKEIDGLRGRGSSLIRITEDWSVATLDPGA